jgi:hypothetical protein
MDQSIHNRKMMKIQYKTKVDCTEHCYHLYTGSFMRVLPDGHVLQKCCSCDCTRTIHRDHLWEKSKHSGCTSVEISW